MAGLFPEMEKESVDWTLEQRAVRTGCHLVAGVDEVGRGPLAGPVVAAAVLMPLGCRVDGLADSKVLTPRQREEVREQILSQALSVGYGAAGAGEIDSLNILRASLLAMKRAVLALDPEPDFLLIDGNQTLDLKTAQWAVKKGDARSVSVASASVLAKVARDRMMAVLDRVFPGYGFDGHKGYATRQHYEALARLGPCSAHRRSFKGVKEFFA